MMEDWDLYFKAVVDYRDAMQEFGLNIFLDYGTLLGYVREGDFIKTDHDVDFGTVWKFNSPEWEDAQVKLREKGFDSNVKIRPFQYQSYRKEHGIDIFILEEHGEYLHLDRNEAYWPKIPRKVILPLQSMKWRGETFLIPNMSELYLTYLYGKYWKFPIFVCETACREKINDNLSTKTIEKGRILYDHVEQVLDNPWNIIHMKPKERELRDRMRGSK